MNLIIHPETMKELGPVLDEAIADLRYGCIGINAWIGMGFLLAETPWGAFPNKQHAVIGRKFTRFEAHPGFAKPPGLFFAALRG